MPKIPTKPKFIIFNLSPWSFGGFTSVTAHAYLCLKEAGWDVQVLRPNIDKDEPKERRMALDVPYRNVSVATALELCKSTPSLMTGVAREKDLRNPDTIYKLIDAGCHVIIHGTIEKKQFQHVDYLLGTDRAVCIRESMRGVLPNLKKYIPQPYSPAYFNAWYGAEDQAKFLKGRNHAGAVAMVVKHKNPQIILEANRHLDPDLQVQFLGGEDRMYAKFTLSKKFPEYKFASRFSSKVPPVSICRDWQFMVDLTVFEVGNGGTQYSFMEAMDAGCVLVIHREWLRDIGCMKEGVNCLAVSDATELAKLIKTKSYKRTLETLSEGYASTLAGHGPESFSKSIGRLAKS